MIQKFALRTTAKNATANSTSAVTVMNHRGSRSFGSYCQSLRVSIISAELRCAWNHFHIDVIDKVTPPAKFATLTIDKRLRVLAEIRTVFVIWCHFLSLGITFFPSLAASCSRR